MERTITGELDWCETTAEFMRVWQNGEGTEADLRRLHAAAPVPDGTVYDPEVVYGTGGLQMLLYSRADTSERRAAYLSFHGGGFRGGSRFSQRREAREFATLGYVAGAVSYRFSDEAKWPAAVEDAKCAVRFLRANYPRLGVDPDRIAVGGGSAGGYLAAMVGLTPGRFEGDGGHGHVSSGVQAMIPSCPVTDVRLPGGMSGVQQLMLEFVGTSDDATLDAASPINHVTPDAPPTLVQIGDLDPAIPRATVDAFMQRLDEAGVANELAVYPGRYHAFGLLDDFDEVFDRKRRFLEKHLGSP